MFLILELLSILLLSIILVMHYKNERVLAKRALPHAKLEGYWDGSERRRYARFREILEVTYMAKNKTHLNSGKTVDISEGGVRLLLGEKLDKATILCLQISLPDSKKMAEIEGEVVWSDECQVEGASGKRFFHCGISFVGIRGPRDTDLIDYICSLSKDPKSRAL